MQPLAFLPRDVTAPTSSIFSLRRDTAFYFDSVLLSSASARPFDSGVSQATKPLPQRLEFLLILLQTQAFAGHWSTFSLPELPKQLLKRVDRPLEAGFEIATLRTINTFERDAAVVAILCQSSSEGLKVLGHLASSHFTEVHGRFGHVDNRVFHVNVADAIHA